MEKSVVRAWAKHCARFRGALPARAVLQILTTSAPFLALVTAMIWISYWSYLAALALAVPAGGLMVRFFIIQHDCGHGSFLGSQKLNDWLGRAMSLLTLTPYGLWRREHAQHHAGSGNLERRGVGDIETRTVEEYRAMNWFERLRYRVYRNPLFLFGFGVPLYFIAIQRLPWCHGLPFRDSWKSVTGLNAAIVVVYGALGYFIGYMTLLKIGLPIIVVAAAAGGWLFFIQHQFEHTVWEAPKDWDFQTAAVLGSSYYVLPKLLQWFTGNIGLHHIHHLNSMVPNYRLQECLDALPELSKVNRLTLLDSIKCVRLTLWCERTRRLVGYREALTA